MKQYQGLTHQKAEELLVVHGKNSIEQKKKNVLLETIKGELKNPIVILLILAAVVSYVLHETAEAIAIGAVVIINLLFTLYQVYKADNAVAALKSLISDKVVVIRDGHNNHIDVTELVPGDIVYLESGSKVPADIKLLEATYTEANESILTGESLPVQKVVTDGDSGMLFMGSTIVVGQLYGEVFATGMKTAFGSIAASLQAVNEQTTGLQKKLHHLTRKLGVFGICAAVLVFILSFIKDDTLFESFLLTISIAVAVVPEGLPAVMTAILSIGVGQMAQKGVIMRRLDAIEGLGGITVLATDKTGTLTENKMTVESEYLWEGNHKAQFSSREIINLCTSYNISVHKIPTIDGGFEYTGDPTEIALKVYSNKHEEKREGIEVLEEVPFSSETRTRQVTVRTENGTIVTLINGAPENVVEMSTNLATEDKDTVAKLLQQKASLGQRTIAFAYRHGEEGYTTFVGFVALKDPLRKGIKQAIDDARSMGIRTVLITGDNPLTAEAIAIEAGITDKHGAYLIGKDASSMSDDELREAVKIVSVYARIAPQEKLRLVKTLQDNGEIVAMTGDGVNDAPALKQADIGVAMGKVGTDVAKEAADAVVTDDNYVTMIDGIHEGRAIVRRIELATTFFVAGNVGEFVYIFLGLLFGLPLISPIQILFINIITDAIPALALSFAPVKIKGLVKKKETLLSRPEYMYIGVASVILGVFSVIAAYSFRTNQDLATTSAFLFLILMQQVMLIDVWLGMASSARDLKKLSSPYILGAVGSVIIGVGILMNTSVTETLFATAEIPLSAVSVFIYGFVTYAAFVFTRVHDKRFKYEKSV